MEGGVSTMDAAVTSFTGITSDVITMISDNETLMVFLCSGLVFIAIRAVKKLIKVR